MQHPKTVICFPDKILEFYIVCKIPKPFLRNPPSNQTRCGIYTLTLMLSEQIEIECADEVKCGNFSVLCTSTNMMGLSNGKRKKSI